MGIYEAEIMGWKWNRTNHEKKRLQSAVCGMVSCTPNIETWGSGEEEQPFVRISAKESEGSQCAYAKILL